MKRVSPLLPTLALGIVALACSENPTATDPATPPDVASLIRARALARRAPTSSSTRERPSRPMPPRRIAGAGGTLVSRYDAIGVAIARSTSSSFADMIVKDKRVEGASATAGFATRTHRENDRRRAVARQHTGSWGRPLILPSVGHGADPCSRGPRDQRWEPVRRRRRHRHWTRLHAPRPGAERGLREQRLLRRRRRES